MNKDCILILTVTNFEDREICIPSSVICTELELEKLMGLSSLIEHGIEDFFDDFSNIKKNEFENRQNETLIKRVTSISVFIGVRKNEVNVISNMLK